MLTIEIAGFFVCSGLPSSPKVWWLTEDERKLAVARMQSPGTKQSTTIGKRMLKRCTSYIGGQMQAWLKNEADLNGTYTIAEIGLITSSAQGLSIVCGILVSSLVIIHSIWIVVSVVTAILFFTNVCLRVWDILLGLLCFSDNPFRTRNDFIRTVIALLRPFDQYRSADHARVRIVSCIEAGFSETAAQPEGFARLLRVVAELLSLKQKDDEETGAR
ncbi:vitamin h transporter [Stemphylium lycopersici]|uniref:Vitamin h transporter n=1 Tax=Stemphylium lycopersici TaxID=183478 RepID=A0A364MUI5_STELY|nr:vitamin h transporter [Stemphylium lycopersici]RAQ99198.1 vitamin h transporter [Stemphylium lycopersici]RAR03897.1 vitamin h transporter [Stemphylium lycopersici]